MARLVLVLACLAVSACGGAKKPDETAGGGGKVLAGSISDAMIDLDRSRAEAPLAGPGAGAPAADSEAARELLAPARADEKVETGAVAANSPASLQDQASKVTLPAPAAAPRDKPAEKAAEPASPVAKSPAKPTTAKPAAKPAVSAPAKPKVKPAFRKPTDESGA